MKGLYSFSCLACIFISLLTTGSFGQAIQLNIDASKNRHSISPWIYGKNNSIGDNPTFSLYNDAGLRIYRENGGNNATKNNWHLKLTSHPDWYNNVYGSDWDASAKKLLDNTHSTQGFYALQLLGKAAYTGKNNFDDWAYDQSKGDSSSSNWAGGGGPGIKGNPDLYLYNWTADSTTGIFNHWFADLGYDSSRFRYWNMDNEPEVWCSTHDDVASTAITAEDFIQKYIAVAKMARQRFPGVKLTGPVSPNEWQWYNWSTGKVKDANGTTYCWMEYFIKRISEEQKNSGLKLLDVLDVHFYPGTTSNPDLTLQLHRVWFDTTYSFSGANGVKVTSPSGWDNSITQEYFFERCNRWLTKYMGANHGVKFGISEYGQINTDPNIVACWYASHLGTFSDHGVELFTPWDWYNGQWEVMHLFSKFFGQISVQSASSNEAVVSAYSSLSADGDSLMVALVNRDRSASRAVNISISNFNPIPGKINYLQLYNLPSEETFISASQNALQKQQLSITSNTVSVTLPALSVTMLQLPTATPVISGTEDASLVNKVELYPNPSKGQITVVPAQPGNFNVVLQNLYQQLIGSWDFRDQGTIDLSGLQSGSYIVQIKNESGITTKKVIKE